MKKRVLSMLMALALCLTLLPTAALAEEAGVVQDAANANSTYTTGENAGLTGGKDGSVPDGTDGGDADSSGEAQDGEADTAVSARTAAQRSTVMSMTRQSQRGMQPIPCLILRAAII